MNNMAKYTQACIIGAGKLATRCISLLLEENIDVEFYDVSINGASLFLKEFCRNNNIEYYYMDRKNIFERIQEKNEQMILFSISNPYIIPEKILKKNNICAINFHHALLPNHPGRNGECWAIYEEDTYAGITWHYIVPEVDAGKIIIQESVELDDKITAFRLFAKQDELGLIGFEKIYKKLLYEELEGEFQVKDREYKLHLAKHRPNDSILDINWNASKMSAFLRSMDYGPLRTLGYACIEYDGITYEIKKYKIIESETSQENTSVTLEGMKFIIENEDKIIQLSVQVKEN